MFIAVESYKFALDLDDDIFPVLDTNDCTVESVSLSEAEYLGIRIENLFVHYNGSIILDQSNLYKFLIENSIDDFVCVGEDNRLVIGDMKFYIDFLPNAISVNGVKSISREYYVLCYPFIYKDYVIFRMMQRYAPNNWYTFAVNNKTGKVEQWSEDMKICTNKALAMQVDMTSEV